MAEPRKPLTNRQKRDQKRAEDAATAGAAKTAAPAGGGGDGGWAGSLLKNAIPIASWYVLGFWVPNNFELSEAARVGLNLLSLGVLWKAVDLS